MTEQSDSTKTACHTGRYCGEDQCVGIIRVERKKGACLGSVREVLVQSPKSLHGVCQIVVVREVESARVESADDVLNGRRLNGIRERL